MSFAMLAFAMLISFFSKKCFYLLLHRKFRPDRKISQAQSMLFGVFIAKDGVELNPSHVGCGDKLLVTEGAHGCGGFRSCLLIWQRMMSEREKAPTIGFGEPFTVFNSCVEPVVLAVEKPTSRRFFTRAIWKRRIKNSSEFLYNHRAFGE